MLRGWQEWWSEPWDWPAEPPWATQICSSPDCSLVPPAVDVCTALYIDGDEYGSCGCAGISRIASGILGVFPFIVPLSSAWLGWKNPGDTRPIIFSHAEMEMPTIFSYPHSPFASSHSPTPLPHSAGDKSFSCPTLRTRAQWAMAGAEWASEGLGVGWIVD